MKVSEPHGTKSSLVHRDDLNNAFRCLERLEGIIPYPPFRLSERRKKTIRIARKDRLPRKPYSLSKR